jgi:hypothetical protein
VRKIAVLVDSNVAKPVHLQQLAPRSNPLHQPIASLLQAVHINSPAIPCTWASLFLPLASQSGSARGQCLVRLMMEVNMNLTFPIADWLFGTSDLNRGVIGHLLNGYDTAIPKEKFAWDAEATGWGRGSPGGELLIETTAWC